MIAIAVVASLVVYAWVMGFIGGKTTQVGQAVQIQSTGMGSNGHLQIYVQNVGQGAVTLDPAGSVYVNNTQYAVTITPATNTLTPGQTATLDVTSFTMNSGDNVIVKVVTGSGTYSQVASTPGQSSSQTQNQNTINFQTAGTGSTTPTGTQTYTSGIPINIQATAGSGYTFSAWTASPSSQVTFGSASSASTTATITGSGAVVITATFQATALATPTLSTPTLNPVSPITLGASVTASVTVSGTAGTPTGQVTFQYSTDSGTTWSTLGTVKTLASGSATSDSYTPLAAGSNYQFRAQYGGDINYNAGASVAASLTVNAVAGATNLVVTGFTNPVTAGTAGTVTVTAKDAGGNTVSSYRGTIHFTSTDGQATLPANYIFTAADNGVHTFTNGVTLKTAGTQSIIATDTVTSSITGSQTGITVNAGTASKLIYTVAPTTVAHWSVSTVFTVQRQDQYGNPTTTGTTTVNLSDNSGGSGAFSSDSQGRNQINSITIGSGSSTGNFYWGYFSWQNLGSKTITAAGTGLTSATTNINVT